MTDILSEIIKQKQAEIAMQKQAISPEQLREQAESLIREVAAQEALPPRRSMKRALADSPTGIISEFKRRSPSKGWINPTAQAETIPASYEAAGAAALSILTDEKFFGGSLRDIRIARPLVKIPILRKDFILDEYQLLQARIVGADAVLLIAACLSPGQCSTLTAQAHALGLEVLLEVHSPAELAHIPPAVDMIGVNNRNLGSFVTDVENSFRLAKQLQELFPPGIHRHTQDDGNGNSPSPLLISESGISHPETLHDLRNAGFQGFLIGETFMKSPAPGDALKAFIKQQARRGN